MENLQPNPEYLTQATRNIRQDKACIVVHPDILDADHNLADAVGQASDMPHPLFPQLINFTLHFRDNIALQRHQGGGRNPHHRILHEQEQNHCQEHAALIDRQNNCIAKKAAQGFDFCGHHRHNLPRGGFLELRYGEAQCALNQYIAQAAQQPFGHDAGECIDPHLEHAVDANQHQKQTAQQEQIRQSFHREAEHIRQVIPENHHIDDFIGHRYTGIGRCGGVLDRPIDDRFGQIEREIKKRKGNQCQDKRHDLFTFRKRPDESIHRFVH